MGRPVGGCCSTVTMLHPYSHQSTDQRDFNAAHLEAEVPSLEVSAAGAEVEHGREVALL